MDYSSICNGTIKLVKQVGQFIRDERKKFTSASVASKGKHDFVTLVDKASEELLVKGLAHLLPGSGFIAEEGTATASNEKFKWVIDPIDGTTNFIHGAPPYSISIGLLENDELVAGVIYEITLDECFYAWKGSKAYLNGNPIHVSDTQKVDASLIATGFPYHDYDRLDEFMKTLEHFFHHSRGVRRLGSAAADLAYVACGRYDAFYEYNLKAWDVAAGAFIIQQAGGKVTDFSGNDNFMFGAEIIASNGAIHDEFQTAVSKYM